MGNRLAHEKSPYLLQHAENPVDWYPWGEEAFARARAEDRPIFLSIGYAACHWCHVMEDECFANGAVAGLMNEHFVNVKVDREERPDVDELYLRFVQATTGGGGWPLSVFLTPEREPFFGGTYFPAEERLGRPGFPTVLRGIAHAWEAHREELRRSGATALAALLQALPTPRPSAAPGTPLLDQAFQAFSSMFDREGGGFGAAPKFPRPLIHDFLLRYFARTGEQRAAHMVLAALAAMGRGGLRDHLAGGFHRYCVDGAWQLPHFEKMLYDQAQIAGSYLDVYPLWPRADVAEVARDTLAYVLRDLRDDATGAFASAEDADSPLAGGRRGEGAFYLLAQPEIEEALGQPAALIFGYHYAVLPEGNLDDPELRGKNVLREAHGIVETARRFGRSPDEVAALLRVSRECLRAWRERRPRPLRDDKILCGWNGLMISTLARAASVLGDAGYLEAAERAARFIVEHLFDQERGLLYRRFRDGERAVAAFLEDYAMLAGGLIDLYQASFELRWLRLAERFTERQIALFRDPAGGFFSTTGEDPTLPLRLRDDQDGAVPCGSSLAVINLARLAALLGRPEWHALAEETVRRHLATLERAPQALPAMLVGLDWLIDAPWQVVLAGEREDPELRALARAVHVPFAPRKLILLADEQARSRLGERLPELRDMRPRGGRATAYVCRAWACERPTSDPEVVKELLGGHSLTGARKRS